MSQPPFIPDAEVFAIELAGCRGKADLLVRIATAMRFPAWFGHNWDALADCLADLSWLRSPACVVELHHLGELRDASPEAADVLLDILADTTAFWADQGIDFRFVEADAASA